MSDTRTATVTVVEGRAVHVDGAHRYGGTEVEVPVGLAARWVRLGYVTRPEPKATRKRTT